ARNLSYRTPSRPRSREAELLARERYRTLTTLDPSNADWRYGYVASHMMECYYYEATGEIEKAREALKKYDALLQDLVRRGELPDWDAEKGAQNSIDLARLAAIAGDPAEAQRRLGEGDSRFQARYDKLPAGSFDRIQARVRWLNMKAEVLFFLKDWAELA